MPSANSHALRSSVLLLLAVPLEAGYLILRRLHNLKLFAVEYIAVSLAMSLFYIVACWWVAKIKDSAGAKRRLTYVFLAGIVFRATLLPLYPSLTEDPFRYRWEGKLQSAGGNPYLVRPQDPTWAGLRDATWGSVNRKDLPTGYGPLLELVYRETYAVVSRLEPNEFRQALLFKIPFLIFDLATGAMLVLLLRALGQPPERVLIYLWSPLVVVELWASGHNDSLLLFLLVAASWAAVSGRWVWAMGSLWMAALTKFWPALLFPVFALSPRLRVPASRRFLWALAWIPVAALLCAPYWRGATAIREMLAGFLGGWRNNASLFNAIYTWANGDFERAKPVVAALVAVAVLLVASLRLPLPQSVLWTTAAILFLSANCFPWYLIWILPLLAVTPYAALLLWTALVPLAYHILIGYQIAGEWREDPFYLYLEYVPVYLLLALTALLNRHGTRKMWGGL